MIFGFAPAIVQAKVSLDRISDFLNKTELLDEFDEDVKTASDRGLGQQRLEGWIGFRDAMFAWSKDDVGADLTPSSARRSYRLRVDGELCFEKGKINLITGPTCVVVFYTFGLKLTSRA